MILILGMVMILSNIIGIPEVLASNGNAWAVTIYKSWVGVVVIKTKTGVDDDYGNSINSATPRSTWETCCQWYHVNDRITTWDVQTYTAKHYHEYTFEHKLCLIGGLYAPPDQTVSYQAGIEVKIDNGQCLASGGGQYSYYETPGGCR